MRYAIIITLALGLVLISAPAMSQTNGGQWGLINGHLQKRANGILSIMGYTLFPDVTTSSLSISSGATGNPGFRMTQLGGGFTVSKSFPLYLEGHARRRVKSKQENPQQPPKGCRGPNITI